MGSLLLCPLCWLLRSGGCFFDLRVDVIGCRHVIVILFVVDWFGLVIA